MHLKSINIHNFKTVDNLEFKPTPGLNVVFGPNEAGKSTFFEALNAVFFVNADSSKAEVSKYRSWEKQADPSVKVVFEAGNVEYELEKTFLGAKKGRLSSKATALDTSNKDIINEELEKIIPLFSSDGQSVKNTFWILQRELEATAQGLTKDSNLRSVLQQIMFQADGDVEEIKRAVKKAVVEHGKGLMRHADYPGPVAQAKADFDRLTSEVGGLRIQLESLDRDIVMQKELTERVRSLETQIKEDDDILLAVEKYQQAKQNLENTNKNLDKAQEEIELFQTNDKRSGDVQKQIAELQEDLQRCEREISLVNKSKEYVIVEGKLKDETTLLEATLKLEGEISDVIKELSRFQEVTKEDIEKSRRLSGISEIKQEALKASQLTVESKALVDVDLQLDVDGVRQPDHSLRKDQSTTFRANQKLGVTIPQIIELKIASGVSNAAELQMEIKEADQSLLKIIEKHGVKSVDELAHRHEEQQRLRSLLGNLEIEKTAKLNSRSIQSLELSVKESVERVHLLSSDLGNYKPKQGESADLWQQKKNQAVEELANFKAESNQIEQARAKFLTKHVTLEQASQHRKEFAREAAKAEASLQETPKMELEDDKIFKLKKNLEANKAEYSSSRDNLMKISGALQSTSVSSDQLRLKESELADAQAQYESNLIEYEAYKILDETLAEAEAEASTRIIEPIEENIKNLLPRLTDNRYSGISLNEGLEIETIGYKQMEIMPDDLSTGGQGQLALAVRLALIKHLSGNQRQTVILDDALVNFDEHRLGEAKKLLSEFALTHQVIYLTCHPEMKNWEGATIFPMQ